MLTDSPPPIVREHKAIRRCNQNHPRWCVERAIITHGLHGWEASWMRRVPACESHWNPYARNASCGGGLYQFLPSTWATTPYRRRWVFKAKWNALAAAWMIRQGRAGEWSCR